MKNELRKSLKTVLDNCESLYILPKDPAISEVLVPALSVTKSCDCMIGYFSSSSFREIAPGLASYINAKNEPIRLVISPYLTENDIAALQNNSPSSNELFESIFFNREIDSNLIVKHTLECFAWLLSTNRLIIKIAIIKNAIMHTKAWLFNDENRDLVALHGSMNFTNNAFKKNREQLTLSRFWKGEESQSHIKRLRKEFDTLWNDEDKDCLVFDVPKALTNQLVEVYKGESEPNEKELLNKWYEAKIIEEKPKINSEPQQLTIPSYLDYENGEFKHQGIAVQNWIAADYKGILEMATGSGKTITSLIGASKLLDQEGPLLIVVSAPYKPLISQWAEEIKEFGVQPINLTNYSGHASRDQIIKQSIRRLKYGVSNVEVLLVSNDTLVTNEFKASIAFGEIKKLLIADECHNLGSKSFISDPPESFNYRLGLSATPVKQYDELGTEELINFFGKICFRFTLDQAVGTCLTEYDYYVHFCELENDELIKWRELTEKINSISWKFSSDPEDPYLNSLLRERRLVLETASQKEITLLDLLNRLNIKKLFYTLIYATDKGPEQLEAINNMLNSLNIRFHQITSKETQNGNRTKEIINSFKEKSIQVLTAKRVLDEGINIPEISQAFILASTTVKRQWVQRRGRLLRISKKTGKEFSTIHDFVTIPPIQGSETSIDEDLRKLIRSELERVWEFSRLSRNRAQENGGFEKVEYLQKLANELDL